MSEAGVAGVDDMNSDQIEPLLQAAWFEALSIQVPDKAPEQLLAMVDRLLDAMWVALARDAATFH